MSLTIKPRSSMSVTPEKYHPMNNIADILTSPTNKFTPLIKYQIYPKKGTKPHYEV